MGESIHDCGLYDQKFYLRAVDTYSKWLGVCQLDHDSTASNIISCLLELKRKKCVVGVSKILLKTMQNYMNFDSHYTYLVFTPVSGNLYTSCLLCREYSPIEFG